jgi:microcystin-dependent protein
MSTSVRDQIKIAFASAKNVLCRRIDVVDNLSSTSIDLPLSANKGKELLQKIDDLTANIFDMIYPVGSIYMSVDSTNPSTVFGGTWVAWGSGQVPVGVNIDDSDFSTVEKTGGEKTHTLSNAEMPSHTHTTSQMSLNTGNQSANHAHSIPALSGTAASDGGHNHNAHTSYGRFVVAVTNACTKRQVGSNGANRGYAAVTSSTTDSSGIGYAATTADVGGHTHAVTTTANATGNNSANHTHSVTVPPSNTGATGADGKHNNLQPYITCYMWKRTA